MEFEIELYTHRQKYFSRCFVLLCVCVCVCVCVCFNDLEELTRCRKWHCQIHKLGSHHGTVSAATLYNTGPSTPVVGWLVFHRTLGGLPKYSCFYSEPLPIHNCKKILSWNFSNLMPLLCTKIKLLYIKLLNTFLPAPKHWFNVTVQRSYSNNIREI